jgi:uncharacterized membrane protein
MAHLLCIIGGISLIVFGMFAKTAVVEVVHGHRAEDTRRDARHTLFHRLVLVGIGLVAVVYGVARVTQLH